MPVYQEGRLCESLEASALQISLKTPDCVFEDYFFVNHGATENTYDFADISCACRLMFLRRDESGQIINLQGQGIDFIKIQSTELLNNLKGLGRVSYQDKSLTLSNIKTEKTITLTGIDVFPAWSFLSELWGSK
jgi:hypothetical protein